MWQVWKLEYSLLAEGTPNAETTNARKAICHKDGVCTHRMLGGADVG